MSTSKFDIDYLRSQAASMPGDSDPRDSGSESDDEIGGEDDEEKTLRSLGLGRQLEDFADFSPEPPQRPVPEIGEIIKGIASINFSTDVKSESRKDTKMQESSSDVAMCTYSGVSYRVSKDSWNTVLDTILSKVTPLSLPSSGTTSSYTQPTSTTSSYTQSTSTTSSYTQPPSFPSYTQPPSFPSYTQPPSFPSYTQPTGTTSSYAQFPGTTSSYAQQSGLPSTSEYGRPPSGTQVSTFNPFATSTSTSYYGPQSQVSGKFSKLGEGKLRYNFSTGTTGRSDKSFMSSFDVNDLFNHVRRLRPLIQSALTGSGSRSRKVSTVCNGTIDTIAACSGFVGKNFSEYLKSLGFPAVSNDRIGPIMTGITMVLLAELLLFKKKGIISQEMWDQHIANDYNYLYGVLGDGNMREYDSLVS